VRRGTLIVLAGPSGVGKGSVVERLRSRDPEGLSLSISATTRPIRPGETDGVDYLFVDDAGFDRMIEADELLEWAEVYRGRRYGTPRSFVERSLAAGLDVILEIDVQGAALIRMQAPDAVLILLTPPSMEALEARLRGRATEDEASIAERLAAAARELEQGGWFDHVVVNDEVGRAADEVAAIIEASRTR
jgi:guanylate kinase